MPQTVLVGGQYILMTRNKTSEMRNDRVGDLHCHVTKQHIMQTNKQIAHDWMIKIKSINMPQHTQEDTK